MASARKPPARSRKGGAREETQALILRAAEQIFAECGDKGATAGGIGS